MAFTILGFVCFATSLVVSSCVAADNRAGRLHLRKDITEAVASPLPKRQEQLWRNETRSSSPPATTWKLSTASFDLSSMSGQDHATPAVTSDSVPSVVATSTQSSFYDVVTQSSHTNGPLGTSGADVSVSETPLVPSSLFLRTSTFEHYLSSSSSIVANPSQQYTSANRLTTTIPSDFTLLHPSSTLSSISKTTRSEQYTTSYTASTLRHTQATYTQVVPTSVGSSSKPGGLPHASEVSLTAFLALASSSLINPAGGPNTLQSSLTTTATTQVFTLSAISSAYTEGLSRSPSLTPTLVTYLSTTLSSITDFPIAPGPSAVLSGSSQGTVLTITTLRQESSASVAPTEVSPLFLSTSIVASPRVQPSTARDNSTILTPVVSNVPISASSSYQDFIPTSESTSGLPQFTSISSGPPLADSTLSDTIRSIVYGTGTISTLSKKAGSSSTTPDKSPSWASPTRSMAPEALNSSTSTISSTLASETILPVPVSTTNFIYTTTVPYTNSIATPIVSLVSSSQWHSSVVSVTAMMSINATQKLSTSSTGYQGWNTTSAAVLAETSRPLSRVVVPTGIVASPDSILSNTSNTSPTLDWKNSTMSQPMSNTTASDGATPSIVGLASKTSSTPQTMSTSYTITSDTRPTRTVTVAPSTGSATSSAIATPLTSPPSPPLTVSQKAGVVIAGTTGFLIAVVAAIYVARRHQLNKARRSSTGSIYPKVAYLYDPPAGTSDRDGALEEALMCGGSSGMPPPAGNNSQASANPIDHSHRYSTSILATRFSDPGNPFRDPEDISRYSEEYTRNHAQAPTGPVAAFAAAIKGYRATSQVSSATFDIPATNQAGNITWPSPTLDSCTNGDARSVSRRSILSEIASMAYNTNAHSHVDGSLFQPPSPYGFHSGHSPPCVRETTYTDPCRDPFEHDLLLKVDTRTETPDFVTVYAPSTESILPARAIAPVEVRSKNPWASSMSSTIPARTVKPLDNRLTISSPISLDTTIVASERFSLVYDNHSSTTYIAPSQKRMEHTISPISPLSGAVHRGWDEIKRYSVEKVVPSVPNLSPPLAYSSLPQIKKKSLPQLRRKDHTLAGLKEINESSTRLPLALKIPFAHNRISGVEAQKTIGFSAHDATRGRIDDHIQSSDSTFSHSVHSLTLLLQNKKSRDLEFACAGV